MRSESSNVRMNRPDSCCARPDLHCAPFPGPNDRSEASSHRARSSAASGAVRRVSRCALRRQQNLRNLRRNRPVIPLDAGFAGFIDTTVIFEIFEATATRLRAPRLRGVHLGGHRPGPERSFPAHFLRLSFTSGSFYTESRTSASGRAFRLSGPAGPGIVARRSSRIDHGRHGNTRNGPRLSI